MFTKTQILGLRTYIIDLYPKTFPTCSYIYILEVYSLFLAIKLMLIV